jgi:hypothetical protein
MGGVTDGQGAGVDDRVLYPTERPRTQISFGMLPVFSSCRGCFTKYFNRVMDVKQSSSRRCWFGRSPRKP